MKEIEYVIWKEGDYYVSQCPAFNVSSFGDTFEEATENLKEELELYFDEDEREFPMIPIS